MSFAGLGRGRGRALLRQDTGPDRDVNTPGAASSSGLGRSQLFHVDPQTGLPSADEVMNFSSISADVFDQFFTIGSNFKPPEFDSSLTNGLGFSAKKIKQEPPDVKPKRPFGQEYVAAVVQKEKEDAIVHQRRAFRNLDPNSSLTLASGTTDLDGISTCLSEINIPQPEEVKIALQPFFDPSKKKHSQKLKISEHRDKILNSVKMNPVTIIEGSTGCGKTTQVPQYIADDCYQRDQYFNIVVTQPRRIAAMSVAKRVCAERDWQLGELVGYQIGMDKKVSENTKILYCTTGVLLQKLITLKQMDQFTHIVIDEVHERSEETDLVLMVVRKFMWTHHAPVRVVIMSATFDTAMLQDYFAIPNPSNVIHNTLKPSVISITEKQNAVSLFYIDQMGALCRSPKIGAFQCEFAVDSPCITWETMEVAYNLIKSFDEMEKAQAQQYGKGAVLVFLPGYEEISEMKAKLENDRQNGINWWVLPLHSSITSDEQQRVFEPAVRGSRKIILATNIAESSITVTDIEYVIDFCLTKNLIVHPETNYPYLRLEWASKANCTQRSGRAGRVREGRCYRLITNEFYERHFQEYPTPELLRMPLEQAVLKVKKLDLGRPKDLLGLCLNPPNLSDINRAILRLKKVGGLSITMNGVYDEEDGFLTAVGRVMAVLPIDVQLSRLVLIGHALDCLTECCIMAACLTLQNLFSRQYNREIQAYKSKLAWADRTFSDALAYLHAFRMYSQYIENNIFTANSKKAKDWCDQTFIQHKRIREVDLLYRDLVQRLDGMNIKPTEKPNVIRNIAEEELFLKICMCGAFYPNYFLRMDMNIDDIRKDLHDKDPRTTVKISNLPQNEGVLYANQIRRLFQDCSDQINLEFEESHALLTFSSDRNPLEEARKRQEFISDSRQVREKQDIQVRDTEVKTSVYVAMKLKQTGIPLKITLYRNDRKRELMERYVRTRDTRVEAKRSLRTNRFSVPAIPSVALPLANLPGPGVREIKLFITEIIDCGHFWAQYYSTDVRETLYNLRDAINNFHAKQVSEVTPGMVVLSPYEVSPGRVEYCRARVDIVRERDYGIKVFYIDYGNSEVKPDKSVLLEIPLDHPIMKTPALAFECELSEIKPSECRTYDGSWHPDAFNYFRQAVIGRKDLKAHVYSVVNRVVRCVLIIGQNRNINNDLINEGYAEYHSELPQSKADHEFRLRSQPAEMSTGNVINEISDVVEVDVCEPENNVLSKDSIRIRGPHTPIEASFHGITKLNFNLKIGIERDSVNSICLEPDPEESVNRLLVAANVSIGASGKLVARSTTLMPCIRGMAAIMSLIFAPTVEFRADIASKKYIGAICGLGYDPVTKESYDKEGDVELQFDVLFSQADIGNINTIRLKLSDTLSSDSRLTESAGPAFSKRQESIRDLFHLLLKKKRIKQQIKLNKRVEFKWGLVPEHLTERPSDEYFENVEHPFLPLISLVKEVDSDAYVKKAVENLDELTLMARHKFSRRTHCMACDVVTYTLLDLSNHLASKAHMDHVVELFPPSAIAQPDNSVEPQFDLD